MHKTLVEFYNNTEHKQAVAILSEKLGSTLVIFKKNQYVLTDQQLKTLDSRNMRYKIKQEFDV